jgi:uncharacterized membrane protein YbhN (UPF0104 family)
MVSNPGNARLRLWRVVEVAITLAVVVAVGWQFSLLLQSPELWAQSLQLNPTWLALSMLLYVLGLSMSAAYWHLILIRVGQRPPGWFATFRAYFVGQLGRYLPGKIVGVIWRSRLLRSPDVHAGVAALTVVYESLTALASALLLGGGVLTVNGWSEGLFDWKAGIVLAVVGLLLVPAIFNRLVDRSTRRWRSDASAPLPHLRESTLFLGMGMTSLGWVLQGASLMALTEGLLPGTVEWTVAGLLRYTAYVAMALAIGLLVVAVPSGLGVREFFLQRLLTTELAMTLTTGAGPAAAALAVLLRLVWVAVDVTAAAVCWFLPALLTRRYQVLQPAA